MANTYKIAILSETRLQRAHHRMLRQRPTQMYKILQLMRLLIAAKTLLLSIGQGHAASICTIRLLVAAATKTKRQGIDALARIQIFLIEFAADGVFVAAYLLR